MHADPRAIQQIELVGQLINVDNDYNAISTDGTQSMFILMILEKLQKRD